MIRKEFINQWQFVRETFFPRWDRQARWKVRIRSNVPWGPQGANCEMDKREIVFSSIPSDIIAAQELLIHEICHAVGYIGHETSWQRRMEKAIARANELGLGALVNKLKEDLAMYHGGRKSRKGDYLSGYAEDVYGEIRDIIMDVPTVSFNTVVSSLSYDLSMWTREFLKRYRRARVVYKKAREEIAKDYQAQVTKLLPRFKKELADLEKSDRNCEKAQKLRSQIEKIKKNKKILEEIRGN